MDTFSLSLCLGSFNIRLKKGIIFSIIVGVFHFIMPILGNLFGRFINLYFSINAKYLLFGVFILLSIQMISDLFSDEENEYSASIFELITLALTVSVDSFVIGIGLNNNILLDATIFCMLSSIFTFLGIIIGRYSYRYLGIFAKIVGIIILVFLAVCQLLK